MSHNPEVTRRLDGFRGTAGVLGALFATAAVSLCVIAVSPALATFRDVNIVDDEFEPPEIVIERGDTIVWVHRGARPHGVRASDGSFDSSPGCSFQNGGACMRNGDRYSRTFDQPGTYLYYCPVHGSANGVGMAGQITVASGGGGGGTTTTAPAPPSTTQTTKPASTSNPPDSRPTTAPPSGAPSTAPPAGSTATSPPQTSGQTTVVAAPGQDAASTSTTLVAGVPINGDTGEGAGGSSLLIGIAAAVVLAAAISATGWYFRPAARPPGGPPPPVTPA